MPQVVTATLGLFVVCEMNISILILAVNKFTNIFLILFLFHVLIDKRKPITGMGCLEFVMLDHNEKLKLVVELINAGLKDPDEIVHCINKIEKELFPKSG